jgi:hypothetical protein
VALPWVSRRIPEIAVLEQGQQSQESLAIPAGNCWNALAVFTAARIAQELGCSRQQVYLQFAKIRPDGETFVRGQRALGWNPISFPKAILERLEKIAVRRGFQSIAGLLSTPPTRFVPTVPFAQVSAAEQERALKLRAVLSPFLVQRGRKDFVKRGVAEYMRAFGHPITEHYWRKLYERTIARDGNREEWYRPELYLPEKPSQIKTQLPIVAVRHARLEVLEDALATVIPRGALNAERKDYLWLKVCDQLKVAIDQGADAKKTKQAILAVLGASGLLGANKESIRRNLNHHWRGYCLSGGNIVDKRRIRDLRTFLPDDDKKKIIARALDCGGRVRQAFRELRDSGELSEDTLARTITNPRNKSYMPASFSREVASEVKRLMPLHRGEREFTVLGPYVPQDYSQLYAGQAYQLDDVTLPVYYWEPDPQAPRGIFFGRGQWVLAIDVRSLMVLGHALHSAPVYNMRIARSLLLRVHDAYGLPESLILERGIWRTARIIKGDELDVTHTEQGLREFGITFYHRTKPRGKIIEAVIGLLQNRMERFAGYAGRDERHDRYERVQERIRTVQAGREHPAECFLSKTQWLQELDALTLAYNSETQNGRLNGASPLETWNANLLPQGTVHLGIKARYLLAHYRRRVKVQRSGIRLSASLGGGIYYGATTGRFVGQQMLAWINPEELDAICLTSLDRRDGPYLVSRAEALPPIGATDAQLQAAQQQIDAHNDYVRTQYRAIQPHLARVHFRRLYHVDASTVALGERIAESMAAAVEKKQAQKRQVQSARRAVRERRLNVNVDAGNAVRATVASELVRQAYERTDEVNPK